MSVQAADRLELDLERTFGGRRFTVRRVGGGYAVLEAGREVAVVGASGNATGLWESALDQLETAGVIERCDRCGDDRARGAGWGRFCGHCADAYDDGADDDWGDRQNRRSA